MDGLAAETEAASETAQATPRTRWRRKRILVPATILSVLLLALTGAWLSRERIAGNLIERQLEAYDLPATYEIERIGGRTQVIRNLVIGDPRAPDLTARRVIVRMSYGLGTPGIGAVILEKPRLYGSYRRGQLSFGTLDKLLFRDSGEPPGLPALALTLRDGRALIESDFGPVGIKADGSGKLDSGFAGVLAATAPELAYGDCRARRATVFGKITTARGAPRFVGPARLGSLDCPSQALALGAFSADLDLRTDAALANPAGEARLAGGPMRVGANGAQSLTGTIRMQLRGERLAGRYTLAARGLATPQALAAVLTADGVVRGDAKLSRIDVEAELEGNGIRPGTQAVGALAGLARLGEGTLVSPIARRIAAALGAEARGSRLEMDLRLRRDGDALTLFAPKAQLTGGSGQRLVAASRLEYAARPGAPARISGNFVTGGSGLPRLNGRMERSSAGEAVFRLVMAPYAAGGSTLAVPGLSIVQGARGGLGFAGEVIASGPLPGGMARNLALPLNGTWSPGGRLALWRQCTPIAFDSLAIANLSFDKRRVTLCPPSGRAILQSGPDGFSLAAGAPSLALSGRLGDTPISLASGPIGFAWPGALKARSVDVTLGPPATASRFRISDLSGTFGRTISGAFSDAEIMLAAVPLDLRNASGQWDYRQGRFTVADGNFVLADRTEPDRFAPLAARGATLALADNIVTARAELRHPASDRLVTVADIRHSLASRTGHADLAVPGLVFDKALQPADLTPRALGVVANALGTVTGTGRIDWRGDGRVTSSGSFSSETLDFAAAFGPVRGASGTIVFSDLLGLTTAPGQKLRIAGVNPGIEVLDGELEFALRDGQFLSVGGASWPFMGGRLVLKSTELNLGTSEERRYIFEIVGLQAERFIAQMELENLSATGTFDGMVPIVFDRNGNGSIESGTLLSRSPGGNISYVGALTYEDLSPMANFAFETLKSLDYNQMTVVMEGPLTGEIVTKVRFDGVRQGAGAKQNFITRRFAALPLEFRVNIKAQFYQLLSSLKAMYDPAAVKDPRELGLLSDDGRRLLRREITGEEAEPAITPEDIIPDEPPIQQ